MNRAILIMFVAMSVIPAGDSAGKILTSQLGVAPVFVAWSRFALGMVLILPFLKKDSFSLFGDWRIWVRAAFLTGGIAAIQTALQTAEVAKVFAAFFVGPMLSYFLAALFLREPITPARSALMCAGFVGVLVVVRPGMGGEAGLIWALVAGLCYGVFLTTSRWLRDIGSPIALTFSQLVISAFLMLPLGLTHLPAMTPAIAGLTLASAACSAFGNLLLLYAYRHAPATRLAPFVYFQLVAAVLLGWSLFGDLPDAYTWAGMAIIMGTGLASTRLR